MKLISFRTPDQQTYGTYSDGVANAVDAAFKAQFPDLKSALAADRIADTIEAAASGTPFPTDDIRFDPVIPAPGKILAVGMNYMAHIREMGREPSDYPSLFVRFSDSVVGHHEPVIRPGASTQLDFEGEVAVIIGRTARHVAPENAYAHVAGYACFMDGSVRDYQRHTTQFLPGKNFRASGAFGPWMVTTDEIPDPGTLTLETRINDQVMQQGRISDLCIGIPDLIAYISTFCQLDPGDVIATGTPSGVGFARDPQQWLQPGDRIEIEVNQIGVLENVVRDE
jgi:2-keto-4-pentenoate hydratase/2-oxohepta-3-ene-1,7-dioic acid hydratase in catechol pathway